MARDFMLLQALQTFSVQEATPWLGRIVQSYRNPISGYTPEEGNVLDKQPYEDNHFTNVKVVASKILSNKAQADFLGLFGFSLETRSTHSRELTTHSVQRLRIHNDDLVLKRILQNPVVIERLEKWGFGVLKPMFMIVGLLIADGISYHEHTSREHATGIRGDPGQIAAIAGGVPIPLTASLELATHNDTGSGTRLFARGRRVFAIEYRVFQRKITANPWEPASIDNTKLRAYGPQGDRAFDLEQHLKASTQEKWEEPKVAFLEEPMNELIDEDAESNYFGIDEDDQPI